MSYARWGDNSDFYAFWDSAQSGTTKEDQRLSLWHIKHEERAFCISYDVCQKVLASSDYNRIPGYSVEYESSLRELIGRFIQDVNADTEFQD